VIPEFGHFALILALLVAVIQSTVPLIGAARHRQSWMAVANGTAVIQLFLIATAFACLTEAYVRSDFSVLNVVQNSHTDKPLLYKISGVWGNHEGSLLLWVLILAVFGAAVALFGRNLPSPLKARTLAVQGMVAVGFLLFVLCTSNPFTRISPAPANGNDLNPLLQDPGLAFHPPMLYFGYVGFSITFSFAIAALIEGRVDPAWARWVRPWTLLAWTGLTAGIALGSWWAYYELGWGGWWFWDPVENASFMPWLLGTALLHSAIVVEKRDALKSWTILLAILTFSLSLMGTFLVRSGVLTSVHAFATDPTRGVFILLLLLVTTGGGLALYAWRAPTLAPGGLFQPISREGGLILNNLLLSTATATVFLGTLYPLFLDAVTGERVTVGPPFFHATFVPLMLPLLLLITIGPLLPWKRADLAGTLARLKLALLLTAVCVIGAALAYGFKSVLGLVGIAVAAWAILGAVFELGERVQVGRIPLRETGRRLLRQPRASWGMTIAHIGIGLSVLGMTGSSAWIEERIEAVRPGDRLTLGRFELVFEGTREVPGANYVAERGSFVVYANGTLVTTMHPERRWYPVTRQETTEAAIRSTPAGDLYVALGAGTDAGTWTARIWRHPLIGWLWGGAAVMVFGGLVSLSDRRYRIGLAARAVAKPNRAAAGAVAAE
jgi:cytochrome c-type biogenesis protein CcmF